MVQAPNHSSLIDFYAKIMKVKVSLHVHVRKFKTNVLQFPYDTLFCIQMVVCKCKVISCVKVVKGFLFRFRI